MLLKSNYFAIIRWLYPLPISYSHKTKCEPGPITRFCHHITGHLTKEFTLTEKILKWWEIRRQRKWRIIAKRQKTCLKSRKIWTLSSICYFPECEHFISLPGIYNFNALLSVKWGHLTIWRPRWVRSNTKSCDAQFLVTPKQKLCNIEWKIVCQSREKKFLMHFLREERKKSNSSKKSS